MILIFSNNFKAVPFILSGIPKVTLPIWKIQSTGYFMGGSAEFGSVSSILSTKLKDPFYVSFKRLHGTDFDFSIPEDICEMLNKTRGVRTTKKALAYLEKSSLEETVELVKQASLTGKWVIPSTDSFKVYRLFEALMMSTTEFMKEVAVLQKQGVSGSVVLSSVLTFLRRLQDKDYKGISEYYKPVLIKCASMRSRIPRAISELVTSDSDSYMKLIKMCFTLRGAKL
jgi:hypothetical protein